MKQYNHCLGKQCMIHPVQCHDRACHNCSYRNRDQHQHSIVIGILPAFRLVYPMGIWIRHQCSHINHATQCQHPFGMQHLLCIDMYDLQHVVCKQQWNRIQRQML